MLPLCQIRAPFLDPDLDLTHSRTTSPFPHLQGAGTGELAVGQIVLYKQTPRSEAVPVKVVDVELPSTNGAMRTKTYYNVCFEDGRMRQTTIANLTVPPTY